MRKILVNLVAHCSVAVAMDETNSLNDAYDKAIDIAEKFVNETQPFVEWNYDNNVEDTDENIEAINEDYIKTCQNCGKQYLDYDFKEHCPYCGHINE